MHAHFVRHVYHRHTHSTYSFGVTEDGAQTFTCRGAAHVSAAGMVMAFNPDDPHDGRAADERGFTYRIVHIGPKLVTDLLGEATEREVGFPLFDDPIVTDPVLARVLRELHRALLSSSNALRSDELLAVAIATMARHSTATPRRPAAALTSPDAARVAERVRNLLFQTYREEITATDLAYVAGRSRYTVYRAFQATYGLAPSDYQRQLRLQEARLLLRNGHSMADAAARAGFADQSHLTRWFIRYFGITPGRYRRAAYGG